MDSNDRNHLSWRAQARRVWKSDTHTSANLHLRDIQEEADRVRAREVIDLVMRIAELSLATGASASETTDMVLQMCQAQGLHVHIDITNTAVMISQPGGRHSDPVTSLRTVKAMRTDYQRLSRLEGLVHKIVSHEIDIATARSRFNDIAVAPRTYRRWVLITASAFCGGAIAMLLGGGMWEIIFAILSAGLVEIVSRLLDKQEVPSFFTNIVGGMIPTIIGSIIVALWPHGSNAPRPSIIVGAGIVSLLAGLNLVSAARDALDGYYITSAARMYEAMVLTAGIVIGVTLTLWLGMQFGIATYLSTASPNDVPFLIRLLCAAIVATTFAIGGHAGPRAVLIASLLAAAGQTVVWLSDFVTHYGPARAGIAAFFIAAAGTWLAPRCRVPLVALISAALIAHVPGVLIYRGLYAALQHDANQLAGQDSGTLLSTAFLIGAALAIGTNLGTLATRTFLHSSSRKPVPLIDQQNCA
ncbi:MAG: threonine/serine ThrE exporter family protein [Propionibacteriaceae bacterium]